MSEATAKVLAPGTLKSETAHLSSNNAVRAERKYLDHATYEVVGAPIVFRILRDSISQLITVEATSNAGHIGRWQITAYGIGKESFNVGRFQLRIGYSPFYFEARIYQRSFGMFSEFASLLIRPKVLRPGDIPVSVTGAWQTIGGVHYIGHSGEIEPTLASTRYAFQNSNIEVTVIERLFDKGVTAQLLIIDDKGIRSPVAIWDLNAREPISTTLKLGQYTVEASSNDEGFHIKFLDKTLAVFPTEVGYVGITRKKGGPGVVTYLSGDWTERGLNLDRHFAL